MQVAEIRSVAQLRVDFLADPELIILSEVLLLNTNPNPNPNPDPNPSP